MIQQHQIQIHSEIPPMIHQQAGAYGLGVPLAVYKPLLPNALAVIGMIVGVIVVDAILLAAIASLTGYVLYILITIPIAAIIYGISALMNCQLRVYQFSEGLIRVKGMQADPIRWDQVTSVVQQVTRRGSYIFWGGLIGAAIARSRPSQSFTVQRSDGAVFKFNAILKNVAQLGQNIQQGLNNGREVLSWNQVQSVDVKQGQIIVKKVGKTFAWANIYISQIPNLQVFLGLANYARTGRAY